MGGMRSWVLVAVIAGCSFDHGFVPRGFEDAPGSGSAASDSGTPDGPSVAIDAAPDAPKPPPGILCPGSMCGSVCCEGCVDVVLSICTGRVWECDGPEDCDTGELCCNDQSGSSCASSCNGAGKRVACHSTNECEATCTSCTFAGSYGQKVCCP
jgi:hypothetical protein